MTSSWCMRQKQTQSGGVYLKSSAFPGHGRLTYCGKNRCLCFHLIEFVDVHLFSWKHSMYSIYLSWGINIINIVLLANFLLENSQLMVRMNFSPIHEIKLEKEPAQPLTLFLIQSLFACLMCEKSSKTLWALWNTKTNRKNQLWPDACIWAKKTALCKDLQLLAKTSDLHLRKKRRLHVFFDNVRQVWSLSSHIHQLVCCFFASHGHIESVGYTEES